MLTQLEELLDHAFQPDEPVDLCVGHSTGGLLGVLAAHNSNRTIAQTYLI